VSDFWPEGYDNPAFRVRRSTYGVVTGGDYVRGSGVTALPSTALRNPTQTFDIASAIGKGLLFCKPYAEGTEAVDYHTVEIIWGWPQAIDMTWEEVALVRSSYGHPSTPSQGQTVFRATREALGGKDEDDENIAMFNPPAVLDGNLPSGWWYYYTLFFRVTTDWNAYMTDGCLLPANYGHQGHLWDGVPPFYQWTDDNYRVNDGFLRQFLDIFGFYLDNTRGFVEGLLDLHHIDKAPMALLKHLGANYGLPYEAGLGDIRYRALLANITNLHQSRGTAKSLEDLIETASKYECDVVGGSNQMLLNDDSDFFTGTGNWAAVHPLTDPGLGVVLWTDVTLATNPATPPAGAPGARGVMRVDTPQASQTQNILITLGDGYVYDHVAAEALREVIPLYGGISAEPLETFGFSIWVKAEKAGTTFTPYLMWFEASGQPPALLSKLAGPPWVSDLSWHQIQVSGPAPAGAVYLVPAVFISSRQTGGAVAGRSPYTDFAASTVYSQASDAPVTTVAPDRYLTLGDPAEQIGPPKSGFEGFLMGKPQEST